MHRDKKGLSMVTMTVFGSHLVSVCILEQIDVFRGTRSSQVIWAFELPGQALNGFDTQHEHVRHKTAHKSSVGISRITTTA